MSQTQAASAMTPPVTYQAWQNWEAGRGLKHATLNQIAALFGMTLTDLLNLKDAAESGNVVAFPGQAGQASSGTGKVPVFGFVAAAGERIAFNVDRVTRYVDRHPAQQGLGEAGVAEVIGESMLPRYRPQELVYFVKHRHPVRGGDVVVEMTDGTAIIKEYDGQRDGKVWLREYYPEPRLISVPADQVVAMHAVVGRG